MADDFPPAVRSIVERHCLDCHDATTSKGGIQLERLVKEPNLPREFKLWERIARVMADGAMPPKDRDQPPGKERTQMVAGIRKALDEYVARHADDPGPVALRRLTSAEYDYIIRDLTGLPLTPGRQFVNDAVGGEGFVNVGDVQFVDDAAMERYLEAAKLVASHAIIGAGPLRFHADRGWTGLELSAMERIEEIYRAHGIRTAAGEGAEPFGLDRYPAAFFVAWRYQHRAALGVPGAELSRIAREAGVAPRLAEHVWNVLHQPSPALPMDRIIEAWRSLPAPGPGTGSPDAIRRQCDDIYRQLQSWQSALSAPAGNDEESPVLTEGTVNVRDRHRFRLRLEPDPDPDRRSATITLTVRPVGNPTGPRMAVVVRDLRDAVTTAAVNALPFGRGPEGMAVGPKDLVISSTDPVRLSFRAEPGATNVPIALRIELDVARSDDQIFRCEVVPEHPGSAASASLALLARTDGDALRQAWPGFVRFARNLPQVTQREPAPSDRDPIPPPFDNKYESPDRNYFHYKVKYHRDDRFLVEHVLDDETRIRLDQAWADLLGAFEYHDLKLRFFDRKFNLGLGEARVKDLSAATIDKLPATARDLVRQLSDENRVVRDAMTAAEAGHVTDALQLAGQAWRRPLTNVETERLRDFYRRLRTEAALAHPEALRALLARVLVAPAFLYRIEPPAAGDGVIALSNDELAARLALFLWSSLPDDELRRAARAGELVEPAALERQTRRLLHDPRARRLAAEFFGQWLGFYRFDSHEGVDTTRFPEFTDSLRASLHDEAVTFCEHLIRHDRPVNELLFADYTFLNQELARHYGIAADLKPGGTLTRVRSEGPRRRGGLLRLGAVLTKTSPPLRTSPVKRGDWVLRQILGTPPPPPPPDAGSLAADDVLPDGLSVRARLEVHRRNPSCANCHARFDPFGFALENFDPIGRWRETYRDGKPVEASAPLRDGTSIGGVEGLEQHLRRERRLFHRTLCSKLLGYALGRGELLSDRPMLDRMVALCDRGGSLSDLAVEIVTSPQFRHLRTAPRLPSTTHPNP